jgi:flagellin-like protein
MLMFRRSRKALSPVVASIILIAVTVAVSIAVAAWMGALTVGFMGSSSININAVEFAGVTNTTSNTIVLTLKNTGTKAVTISQVKVNNVAATTTPTTLSMDPGEEDVTLTIAAGIQWVAGNAYKIDLYDSSGQVVGSYQANSQPVGTQWLSGWNFRKSHVIDGSAANAGTEYQIRLIAHYGIGADNGENVYLGNKAKTDFGDVRFVQSDNHILLSYWLESEVDGVTATFWVKIDGNLTVQSQTIYVYYGNNQATLDSNGETTFVFFDDFSGDLSKWVKEKNGDHIYINSGHLVLDGGTTSSPYGHTVLGSSANYSVFNDGVIEADIFPSSNALPEIGFRGVYSSNIGYKARWDCRSGSESPWMKPAYNGWNSFGTSITRCGLSNQWQKVKIEVIGSTFKIYSNDVLKSTVIDGQYENDGEISLQNHYGASAFYENIRVRKFVSLEPIHSFWGVEESYS